MTVAILHTYAAMSFPQIARAMGGRGHSTAITRRDLHVLRMATGRWHEPDDAEPYADVYARCLQRLGLAEAALAAQEAA